MRATTRAAALPLLLALAQLPGTRPLTAQATKPDPVARPAAADVAPRAATLSRVRPEAVGMSSAHLDALTAALRKYVDDGRLPGGVLLVARHGRIAYMQAFGAREREASAPMREDAIFRIASQSKALVTLAAMILQEEGALLLSDPVGKYLPEFQKTTVAVPRSDAAAGAAGSTASVAAPAANAGYDVVSAKRPITIRDLVTHTSGVSYGYGPAADRWKAAGIQGWYFADRDEPIAATIARMAALPFDAQPGEKYLYGYGLDILGPVLEKASGMPLDRLMQTRVFDPLKMRDTHFYLPPAQRDRLATVYSLSAPGAKLERAPDAGTMQSQGQYVDGPRKSFSGGAGLLSTATDYARFLQMMLNGGELDGVRLLSPKSVQIMTSDYVGSRYTDAAHGFGLGFSITKDLGATGEPGSPGEYGWGGAYHSTYWVDPREDMVVVYLTQVIPAAGLDDMARVRAMVYGAITDGGRR